jgi:hypothetical protein
VRRCIFTLALAPDPHLDSIRGSTARDVFRACRALPMLSPRIHIPPGKSVSFVESATGLIETRTADASGRQISEFSHPDNRPSMWMQAFAPPERRRSADK